MNRDCELLSHTCPSITNSWFIIEVLDPFYRYLHMLANDKDHVKRKWNADKKATWSWTSTACFIAWKFRSMKTFRSF